MKINIVAVGNLKDKFFTDACAEYEKRLRRYCKTEIREITESNEKKEALEILNCLKGYVIVLAIEGKNMSSEEFADFIEKKTLSASEFTFVIGGSTGLDDSVKQRADLMLGFGRMTFPHRLARVMLLEQIYRAFGIIHHTAYHK